MPEQAEKMRSPTRRQALPLRRKRLTRLRHQRSPMKATPTPDA